MPRDMLILFGFFSAFVVINFSTYLFLFIKMKEKVFRELTLYWFLVIVVFIVEGMFQEGKLLLSVVFILNLAPIYILSNFLLRSYGMSLNLTRYIIASAAVIVLAIFNNSLGLSFTTLATPIALVACFPCVEAIYATFVIQKNSASLIHKFMAGIVFTSGIFCSLNYAINRMNPGAELFGFGTGFLSYIAASIIIPVFTIQEINNQKTQHLEKLVQERTDELMASKVQKEKLLRVVVHDISNALQALVFHTNRLRLSTDPKVVEVSAKMIKNINAITDITQHVKELERSKNQKIKLAPLHIGECLEDIKELFHERFNKKNIKLHFINKVPENIAINVDKVTFVHSVVSNIISNALKFSHAGSEVIVTVYESQGHVSFDFQDYGTGMNEKVLVNLFEHEISFSMPGTEGERGTGLGMPLVKNYTELFGGRVNAFSTTGEELSGTRIVVTLPAFQLGDNPQPTSFN